MTALRSFVLRVRRATARRVLLGLAAVLTRIVSAAPYALVYGLHDDEENTLTTLLALTRAYEGNIYVLANEPELLIGYLNQVASVVDGDTSLVRVRHRTLARTLWMHCRAELVFTTHVLISAPLARPPRFHVLLSHGWGPKRSRTAASSENVIAATTSIWNATHLADQNKLPSTRFLDGMPRTVMVERYSPAQREAVLQTLGLDAGRPIALWAPTYRETYSYGLGRVREGHFDDGSEHEPITAFRTAAEANGVQLVVKPHPVEAATFEQFGLKIVTNAMIWEAGATPMQFLGMADGLISDYSSIWVDYLATGRSLLLYCPDLDAFSAGRGIAPPALDELAGDLMYSSTADIEEFFLSISKNQIFRGDSLSGLRSRIGYRHSQTEDSDALRSVRALSPPSIHWMKRSL